MPVAFAVDVFDGSTFPRVLVSTLYSILALWDDVCGLTRPRTSTTEYGAEPCTGGVATGAYVYRCVRGKQISLAF